MLARIPHCRERCAGPSSTVRLQALSTHSLSDQRMERAVDGPFPGHEAQTDRRVVSVYDRGKTGVTETASREPKVCCLADRRSLLL